MSQKHGEYSVHLRAYPELNRMLDSVSTWDYPRKNPVGNSLQPFRRKSRAAVRKSERKSNPIDAVRTHVENKESSPRWQERIPNNRPLWLKFLKIREDGRETKWVCWMNQGAIVVYYNRHNRQYFAFFYAKEFPNSDIDLEKLKKYRSPIFVGESFGKAMKELTRWRGFHTHGSLSELYPKIHWSNAKPPRNNTRTITHAQGFFYWHEHDWNYKGGFRPTEKKLAEYKKVETAGDTLVKKMQERETPKKKRRKKIKVTKGWTLAEMAQGYRDPNLEMPDQIQHLWGNSKPKLGDRTGLRIKFRARVHIFTRAKLKTKRLKRNPDIFIVNDKSDNRI